jgi:hypothetical protein
MIVGRRKIHRDDRARVDALERAQGGLTPGAE